MQLSGLTKTSQFLPLRIAKFHLHLGDNEVSTKKLQRRNESVSGNSCLDNDAPKRKKKEETEKQEKEGEIMPRRAARRNNEGLSAHWIS